MKNIFLLTCLIGGFLSHTSAQYYKNAIGLRLGTTAALTYKSFIAKNQALEAQVGLRFNHGLMLAGLYQYHGNIGTESGLRWYVGIGIGAGLSVNDNFGAGLLASVGLEYKFRRAPICISLDYQPILVGFSPGFAEGGLSVRYTFDWKRQ